MSEVEQSGRPGRYQRSTGGLIGAVVVLLLVVFGFVLFRGAFRDTPTYEPESIDYVALVTSVQQAGLTPAYPPELPDGWFAKDASFAPGDRPALDLVFATDDERTAGIHQEDADERDLLTTYVGDGASETDETLTTPLGTWTGWTDTDGDHAWTTELGDETVLVYGSGDADALQAFVQSLTTEPLEP